ncbi:hypothetical protein [Dyadobacter sp. NIV53]|nr:hypothetical protein [Dyadobacter sp. NIV53]
MEVTVELRNESFPIRNKYAQLIGVETFDDPEFENIAGMQRD